MSKKQAIDAAERYTRNPHLGNFLARKVLRTAGFTPRETDILVASFT